MMDVARVRSLFMSLEPPLLSNRRDATSAFVASAAINFKRNSLFANDQKLESSKHVKAPDSRFVSVSFLENAITFRINGADKGTCGPWNVDRFEIRVNKNGRAADFPERRGLNHACGIGI